ncbi:unnamed protein product [Rotaria sordida]|uniref:Uncharacterized protein n=1 Tax=Rotaria sordida TaxID=392033 RepID=A0A814S180_9BILA|nr:unnamed protein product [Rotaria sordida]CAF1141778.1 unnamed protein product [Rotaria sordida]CAF1185000.1 unnamed protein product [Rotaria sordida]CAF1206871.1 unnamed protein product [Rotaria sordida]CAF1233577.1 unnamed protein product [Rotaria sordida]
MLLTILARMSNDEQRLQLLQTLRNKLTNYNLNWLDIRNIINLFSKKDQIRFNILQFLLLNINNLTNKINIDDYIYLSNQCTNNNEQLKFYLFELIYKKLNIQNKNDFECIINLFQTINIKQKVENMIRIYQSDLIIDKQEGIMNWNNSFKNRKTKIDINVELNIV